MDCVLVLKACDTGPHKRLLKQRLSKEVQEEKDSDGLKMKMKGNRCEGCLSKLVQTIQQCPTDLILGASAILDLFKFMPGIESYLNMFSGNVKYIINTKD